ncbi:hybrid sensor histidine kinase/response regulator [Thioclava sp. FR2]|uniref:hybrid sensor histidine kinase/response regulator n=1 Tax=Thioclava sp. FR2 TaxID=3445780 RepID=UPI003EBB140B
MTKSSTFSVSAPSSQASDDRAVLVQRDDRIAGAEFIFHDFEKSKIAGVKQAIERKPVRLSLIYFLVVMFWTVIMTYGSIRSGQNPAIVNLTPHVTLFCGVLGVFFYPFRLIWVPLIAFIPVFAFPFVIQSPLSFGNNPGMTLPIALYFFTLNLWSSLTIGVIMNFAFHALNKFQTPYDADLNTIRTGFFAFGLVCAVQAFLTFAFIGSLTPAVQAYLGYEPETFALVANRILRGSVVVTAFMLAVLEAPNRTEFSIGILVSPVFVAIGILKLDGWSLFPTVDVAAVAVFICLKLPTPSAVVACILGIPVYAAITGDFLSEPNPADIVNSKLAQVSTVLLVAIVVVLGTRSRNDNATQSLDATSRRLNRIRKYAGVGVFSVDTGTDKYRLDSAAADMIGCKTEGALSTLLDRIAPHDRPRAEQVLLNKSFQGETISVEIANPLTGPRTVETFTWFEKSGANDRTVFGLMIDLTVEAQRKENLETALIELRMRDEKQRQLFSIISHELRTPASVISMLVEDLSEKNCSSQLPQLQNASNQLLAILGDMKQAVNPEQNLPIHLRPYAPKELADFIGAALGSLATETQSSLRILIADEGTKPRIGDLVRNRQMVSNLVRNALLHSGGTNVVLSWELEKTDDGDFSIWRVSDDGRGISEEEIERLFEPFERGKEDVRRGTEGSGLGLYIARTTARSLGGDLSYQPASPSGSIFTIRIPEGLAVEEAPKEAATTQYSTAPTHLRILIAEDNATVSAVMEARFGRHFEEVRIVENGAKLIEAAREMQPDVIVTDLFMPELDGDEAARALRKEGFSGPIIGLTAAAIGEEADRFTSAGVDLVLYKPVNMDAVHGFLTSRFDIKQSKAG